MNHRISSLIITVVFSVSCSQLQSVTGTEPNFPTMPPSQPAVTATALPTIELPTQTLTPTQTYTPAPTDVVDGCDDVEGQVIETSFLSAITGQEFHYEVYLPPCYATSERRYPYIIMLHGLGEGMDDGQWGRIGLTHAADVGYQRGALPPMLIIMPNGLDARHDYDDGPYPQVIVEELIPHIDQTYCTWDEPSKRAIGGLSRGGYWAFGVAFTYPDLFTKVGGHSPYVYQGDYTPFNAYNMVAANQTQGINQLSIYIDHGINDTVVDQLTLDFVNLLRGHGIEPEYVINPVGAHTEEYWASRTADYLTFYSSDWPRDVRDFPTCHTPSP